MDISFSTTKLEKVMSCEKTIVQVYGPLQAKIINRRIFALKNSPTLVDFWPPYTPPHRCHELTVGVRRGQLSIDLKHPYRLIFVPNHDPLPMLASGGLNWAGVTSITIIGVEDTHDGRN